MRIISKFRDYYDSALAHGHDATTVFTRHETLLDDDPKVFHMLSRYSLPEQKNDAHEFFFSAVSVLFCGVLHRGMTVFDRKHRDYYGPPHTYTGETFYCLEDLRHYLNACGIDTGDTVRRSYKGGRRKEPFFKPEVVEYFADNGTDRHRQWAIDNRVSVLVASKRETTAYGWHLCSEYRWKTNAKLADYQFYREFDAFAAYQELEMWISGVLPRSPHPTVEIEDKYKIAGHGFDKWSFRTPPTKVPL